jgi:hypothetical protein
MLSGLCQPNIHPWGRASEEFQVYLGDSLNTSNKQTFGQINLIDPQICLSSPGGLGLVMPYSSFLMKIDFLNTNKLRFSTCFLRTK